MNTLFSTAIFARVKVLALAVAFLFCSSRAAIGLPISADVLECVADFCTIEPVDGPVDVDPLGFTLDVAFTPYLLLNEDPGGHGLMKLFFTFTGVHDGTEGLGQITLRDPTGSAISELNVQFDDLNAIAGVVTGNYEIRGPSSVLGGFSLSLSDGSGVDTMAWTGASIFPAELIAVPEPSLLWLLGAGFGLAVRRRRS